MEVGSVTRIQNLNLAVYIFESSNPLGNDMNPNMLLLAAGLGKIKLWILN